MAAFLRFTERYWFHEVSDQAQIRDLFRRLTGHLGTDRIFKAGYKNVMYMRTGYAEWEAKGLPVER